MRTVVKLDLKIDKQEALDMLADYGEWYKSKTGIDCEWYVERHDFSVVPTATDPDGDLKPTYGYREDLAKGVHDRYGDYGTDNILMWVHEDNFLFKGVWGVAWSYRHFKYNFLLCRWDKDNKVNTWNTLFHEDSHPHDTTIKKELGIDVVPMIATHFGDKNFTDYDRDYVHGNSDMFKYIGRRGYRRDGRMLEFLAPYLRRAYKKRKDEHTRGIGVMKQTILLLSEVVRLLTLLKKKNSV